MLLLPKTIIYIGNTLAWFYGIYHQLLDVIFVGLFEIIYNNIFKLINQVFDGIFHGIFCNRNELDFIIM